MTSTVCFENLPVKFQRELIGFFARVSVKTGLLDKSDIKLLTGYSDRAVEEMLKDPRFPAPYEVMKNGHKRWRTGEVQAFIDSKRKDW